MSDEQKTTIPDNAPWWAKSIGFVGQTFGVSALILAFYMGQSAGLIPNPVAEELQEIKGVTLQHDASMKELVKVVEEQGRQLADENKSRQMRCVLRAKTDEEKKSCFPAMKGDH